MRLAKLHIAGFKSFPDRAELAFDDGVTAIVGPNGCGKSNIIDAVRWVLGESSAKHLRGETMQDVLFNGSGNRQPVNRASVELIFDNSLGKAGGQWASFAEISVKRLLERDGDSSYYINNIHVRRRDIADIFLGTGVGAGRGAGGTRGGGAARFLTGGTGLVTLGLAGALRSAFGAGSGIFRPPPPPPPQISNVTL